MKQFLLGKIKENPMLAMIICCAVPLVAIWAFSAIGELGSLGYFGLMLLCPVLHIMMFRKGHSSHHAEEDHHATGSGPALKDLRPTGQIQSINKEARERRDD